VSGVSGPPEDLARRWQQAEERLYPVVLVRPDLYEFSVRLARAVADRLASSHSEEDLTEAYAEAAELVARAAREEEIPTEDLNLNLVVDAAFSLRRREVIAEMHRAEAIRRIQVAQERGLAWAMLYETGSGFPPMPYRRLEMHVLDGVGVHAFIEEDPDTGLPVFGVEAVQLEPATGDWAMGAPQLAERTIFDTRQTWERGVEHLKGRLSPP
jgi:hypothetical protein